MLKELYFGQITFRVPILNIQVEVSSRELEVLLRGIVRGVEKWLLVLVSGDSFSGAFGCSGWSRVNCGPGGEEVMIGNAENFSRTFVF